MGRELGKQLASLRQAAGLTQHKLATLTGYARGTISAVEAGRFDQSRDFWRHCDDALRADGGSSAATTRSRQTSLPFSIGKLSPGRPRGGRLAAGIRRW